MVEDAFLHLRGVEDNHSVACTDVAAVGDYLRNLQPAKAPGNLGRSNVDGVEGLHFAFFVDIDEERAVTDDGLGDDGVGFLASARDKQ